MRRFVSRTHWCTLSSLLPQLFICLISLVKMCNYNSFLCRKPTASGAELDHRGCRQCGRQGWWRTHTHKHTHYTFKLSCRSCSCCLFPLRQTSLAHLYSSLSESDSQWRLLETLKACLSCHFVRLRMQLQMPRCVVVPVQWTCNGLQKVWTVPSHMMEKKRMEQNQKRWRGIIYWTLDKWQKWKSATHYSNSGSPAWVKQRRRLWINSRFSVHHFSSWNPTVKSFICVQTLSLNLSGSHDFDV